MGQQGIEPVAAFDILRKASQRENVELRVIAQRLVDRASNKRVRRMGSPGGWLYRVALNDLRRRCRRQAIERELLRRQAPPPVAPAAVEPHLWEAVRALPERQRTAVALRYVLDLPEADVARLMGVTRGSASATLTAARRRLESLLANTRPAPPLPPAPAPPAATPPASAAGTVRPGRLGPVAVRRG